MLWHGGIEGSLARRDTGQDAAAKGRRGLTCAASLPLCTLRHRGDRGIKSIFTAICNYMYTINIYAIF